jgi:hypothetical protein
LTWGKQARLTHPLRAISDVTEEWSLTSIALYVLTIHIIIPYFITISLQQAATDAPVNYVKRV